MNTKSSTTMSDAENNLYQSAQWMADNWDGTSASIAREEAKRKRQESSKKQTEPQKSTTTCESGTLSTRRQTGILRLPLQLWKRR